MNPIFPDGGLALASLDAQLLHPGVKGLPITTPLRQGEIGRQHWNVLAADTSFPVALLKTSALRHNLDWMRQFCDHFGALLAPHGKTTMSPQLFGAQLANGAWGITLATMAQVQTAYRFGVRRILLANQLVAKADIAAAIALLQGDPTFELFALVDSLEGVERLSRAARDSARALPLLVELGINGKRAGCRTRDQALAVARAVGAAPGLQLAGVEGYEGLLSERETIAGFVLDLVELLHQLDGEQLFAGTQILLSAGGSAYFDLVARGFAGATGLSRPVVPVLRSGCYLTSDHGFYHALLEKMALREKALPPGALRSALEVWSVVQSRPEPGLAILSMGKRDASYDIDLPIPLMSHRPGSAGPLALAPGCRIEAMNDQHAYLRVPPESTLAVGDLIGCGISHPCTTFDKWPLMLAVDDDYTVQCAINTFF
jgi:D-serine dehydratase